MRTIEYQLEQLGLALNPFKEKHLYDSTDSGVAREVARLAWEAHFSETASELAEALDLELEGPLDEQINDAALQLATLAEELAEAIATREAFHREHAVSFEIPEEWREEYSAILATEREAHSNLLKFAEVAMRIHGGNWEAALSRMDKASWYVLEKLKETERDMAAQTERRQALLTERKRLLNLAYKSGLSFETLSRELGLSRQLLHRNAAER